MWDVVIVGGGPAGLTAALYASRAGLSALVLEGAFVGGQVSLTSFIENFPGMADGLTGAELGAALSDQAKRFGAAIVNSRALSLSLKDGVKRVVTKKDEYTAKAVILCMGSSPRKLDISGEDRLTGAGVSYCATCDGAFFKGRPVAVIGGGETAAHDALYLAQLECDVHLIHRRDELRAPKAMRKRLEANPRITIHWDTLPLEFLGGEQLEQVLLENVKTHVRSTLLVGAAFVAIGTIPQSALAAHEVDTNEFGEIVTSERLHTSINGVFAAGDVRNTPLRQAITACADGALAANEAIAYINSLGESTA